MSDLFAYNTSTLIQIEAHWCGGCGIPYGLPEGFLDERRRDHKSWSCPNGCSRHYPPGKTDAQKLEEAKARETALRDQLTAAIRDAETSRVQLLRDRQRYANGVCPCCNRYFPAVQRHMASQHPEYDAAAVRTRPKFRCGCGRRFESFRGLRVHQGLSRSEDWAEPSTWEWRRHLTAV